jgi:flagellin
MAQVINTNVASLFAGSALNKSAHGLQGAMQRLSSGLRINSAADDPTGLGIGVNLDAKVRGANMAAKGAANAVTAAQTNDGYLAQITENTQRLREIAVQLGGTAAGSEATALIAENTRITGLMNATTSAVVVNTSGGTLATSGTKLTTSAGTTVANYDTDLTAINDSRARYGADIATFSSVTANLQLESVNLSAQYSRVMDTDYAIETQNMTRNQILQQAGTAMLAQANQVPNTVLTLLR